MFEINNEIDFILSEVKRLRNRYPKIQIAPMLYLVEDNKLYFIKEDWIIALEYSAENEWKLNACSPLVEVIECRRTPVENEF